MNFEKCAFCQKRISKTARMDAKYCSAICRMNALRIRKREKRLADRELAKAKEADVPDAVARQQAAKVAFLTRVAGARLAAQLPNLAEHPLLTVKAEIQACSAMLAHYEKRRQELVTQLNKIPGEDELNFRNHVIKKTDALNFPREATLIGVCMLSGEIEGDAMVFTGYKPSRGQAPDRRVRHPGGGVSFES